MPAFLLRNVVNAGFLLRNVVNAAFAKGCGKCRLLPKNVVNAALAGGKRTTFSRREEDHFY